tara:strand:+ start:816 stop:1433 length:618 start_codon:yes stop_codon:yes gene_type:complete
MARKAYGRTARRHLTVDPDTAGDWLGTCVVEADGVYATPRNRTERRKKAVKAAFKKNKETNKGRSEFVPVTLNLLGALYDDTKRAGIVDEVGIIPAKVEETPKPRRKSRVVERGYERKHKLVDLAKQRADYRCEVAGCTVELFTKPDGQRYVEVHHLIGMAEGGPDTLENLVCVCANHHRELHYGERKEELKKQLQQLRAKEKEE